MFQVLVILSLLNQINFGEANPNMSKREMEMELEVIEIVTINKSYVECDLFLGKVGNKRTSINLNVTTFVEIDDTYSVDVKSFRSAHGNNQYHSIPYRLPHLNFYQAMNDYYKKYVGDHLEGVENNIPQFEGNWDHPLKKGNYYVRDFKVSDEYAAKVNVPEGFYKVEIFIYAGDMSPKRELQLEIQVVEIDIINKSYAECDISIGKDGHKRALINLNLTTFVDIDDTFSVEMKFFRSAHGNNQYHPIPYRFQKLTLYQAINGYYKKYIGDRLEGVDNNLPYFEGKWDHPLKKGNYYMRGFEISADDAVNVNAPEGFYKIELFVYAGDKSVALKIVGVSKIFYDYNF